MYSVKRYVVVKEFGSFQTFKTEEQNVFATLCLNAFCE